MINSGKRFVIVLEENTCLGWAPTRRSVMDGDAPLRVAADFGADQDPGHDDWRVRVWQGDDAGASVTPVAELTAEQVRAAVANRSTGAVARAGKRHHRPRTWTPPSAVVERVAVDRVQPGMLVLVTADRQRAAFGSCEGPLYPAADPDGADAVAVKQVEEVDRGGAKVYALVTSKGRVGGLDSRVSFIPAA